MNIASLLVVKDLLVLKALPISDAVSLSFKQLWRHILLEIVSKAKDEVKLFQEKFSIILRWWL